MKNLSRRIFIKNSVIGAFSLTGILQVFTSNLTAEEKPLMFINHLIDALRATNNPVCEIAAAKLLLLKDNKSSYDLHLRNANLNNEEIDLIAKAIKTVDVEGGPSLQSFSMSYSPNLRDHGVLSLVKTLPSTVTEIGLVQCGISDKGGEALLVWAAGAPKLHWLCVEKNYFSNKTKEQFIKLGKERNHLLVVV
ncbi:MAG: hypothetical protein V7782_06255 [Psychromonas sp.]